MLRLPAGLRDPPVHTGQPHRVRLGWTDPETNATCIVGPLVALYLGAALAVDWARCGHDELFNHTSDTLLYDVEHNGEPLNLAGTPAVANLTAELRALLRRGFGSTV